MVMHAQGAVASSKGARLFVMPTKHGIWIALYQRNCVRQEKEHEKEEEDKNKGEKSGKICFKEILIISKIFIRNEKNSIRKKL